MKNMHFLPSVIREKCHFAFKNLNYFTDNSFLFRKNFKLIHLQPEKEFT